MELPEACIPEMISERPLPHCGASATPPCARRISAISHPVLPLSPLTPSSSPDHNFRHNPGQINPPVPTAVRFRTWSSAQAFLLRTLARVPRTPALCVHSRQPPSYRRHPPASLTQWHTLRTSKPPTDRPAISSISYKTGDTTPPRRSSSEACRIDLMASTERARTS
ncbi:hypothetical protein BDY21DRAFT_49722 [Lineolata rhizophorae]|uniref:Uncharacterized protein n=1 Tax=Lineolata rhizophorae TaxID=578093 RepID=A0A6A6NX85_9PEZI|nr:hypothetical protein BDY21DRAFT_49722 [Lineolata rhizophorae]